MNKIFISIAIVLIMGAMTMPVSYGDDQYSDEDLRVFEGKVVNVDVGNSAITVSGAADQIIFAVSSGTTLDRDGYDIKLSDINKNDYVKVQYYRHGSESRVPFKVISVTVEYGSGG